MTSRNEDIVASVLARLSSPPNMDSVAAPKAGSPEASRKKKGKRTKKEPNYPVPPRIIQTIKRPKTYMNHTYRDFSSVPPEIDHVEPTEIADMSFAQKVHHMLTQEDYHKWIAWMPHGRSFRILVPKRLEQAKVLQKYFGHNRYSSFLRQLNNFGFKHCAQGSDRNTYYHEFMLRGLPHLAKYMPESKDARRLIPDPENEPNFYAISKQYPVPGSSDAISIGVEGEEQQQQPQQVKPAAEPPAKIPRVVLPPQLPVVVDVAQARAALAQTAALSQLQKQLRLEQELSALHQVRLLQQRQEQQKAAASIAAYSELLRKTTLANLLKSHQQHPR